MFPYNLSSGAFLGSPMDMTDVLKATNPYEKVISKFLVKAQRMQQAVRNEQNQILNAINNVEQNVDKVIENTLKVINGNYGFTNEELTTIKDVIKSNYKSNDQQYVPLQRTIQNAAVAYMNDNTATFDPYTIENFLKYYYNAKRSKNLQQQNQINTMNQQIRNMQNAVSSMQDEMDPYEVLKNPKFKDFSDLQIALEVLGGWKDGGNKAKQAYQKGSIDFNTWLAEVLVELGYEKIKNKDDFLAVVNSDAINNIKQLVQSGADVRLYDVAAYMRRMPTMLEVLRNGYNASGQALTRKNPEIYSDYKSVNSIYSQLYKDRTGRELQQEQMIQINPNIKQQAVSTFLPSTSNLTTAYSPNTELPDTEMSQTN